MLLAAILMLTINPFENSQIDNLKDLKWKKRVLVVNTSDRTDTKKLTDVYNEELKDRDFVVIQLDGQDTYLGDKRMSRRFTKSLLKKIKNHHERDYFILLGKDGGVKNSFTKETGMKTIFNEVDRMPMRMNEMRKRIDRD